MDANWSFKPAATAVNFDHARLPGSSPAVAPTVLPAEDTVRPAAESAPLAGDFDSSAKATKGEVVLDAYSHQVIYRVRDADSRRVIWQVPDAATLRLRAYHRAGGSDAESAGMRKADLEA
ncbi:MAG: hypothetical protein R3D62_03570 [Xanthobacteraceae bacterium]